MREKVAALQDQLQHVKEAPAAALKLQETRQETRRFVLIADIAGLMPEGVSEAETVQRTNELISKEVSPLVEVQSVLATRMGRF